MRNTVSEYDGPKLGNEVKAEVHEVRRDKIKVDQLADLSGTMDVERPGPVISCISNSGGFMQSAMPEVGSFKLGNEVKAAIHEVRRDKVEVEQTMEVERPGPVISCMNNCGRLLKVSCPKWIAPKLGNEVKSVIHEVRRDKTKSDQSAALSGRLGNRMPEEQRHYCGRDCGETQEHQAVQSAVPDLDGLKLGNEVKAEIHDVRRDKTKSDQSVSLSGTIKVEH